MKKLIPYLFLLVGCSEPAEQVQVDLTPEVKVKQNNPEFITKYAGTYSVEVVNQTAMSPEIFDLYEDRYAEWGWERESKKPGRWAANQDTITIKIQGNSGDISETYVIKNGKFTEVISGERYLKPRKTGL